jgi:hypothetical protein
MSSHQAVLLSLDLRCAYSHSSSKMVPVEFLQGTSATPEKAVYVCPVCGRQKLVVHRLEAALTNTHTPDLRSETRTGKRDIGVT